MTLVLHSDNINNIHYKVGLNMYIVSYAIVLHISIVNPCGYGILRKNKLLLQMMKT